ncbi:hypothetical protein R82291_FJPPFKPJ_00806 [Fructobacillus cardui]|uniref:hypothetical protein n=1 Tax=Fructobacillus cardui TaxID=2893170 RepID=UPI002D866110|nr:hypothetical protein R82291_FJPPFKPJ_00806 [Fructobacillus cardui]
MKELMSKKEKEQFIKDFRKKAEEVLHNTLGKDYDKYIHLFPFNNKFNFHIVRVDNFDDIIFAEINKNQNDDVVLHDITKLATDNLNINTIHSSETIAYLFENKYFSNINQNNILINSIVSLSGRLNGNYPSPNNYARLWITGDYRKISKKFTKRQSEVVTFDSNLLNRSTFEFEKMIEDVNDDVFTNNLNQVIGGYNKGWFYISAAGIGGLIETLLYKTIINYGITDIQKTKAPTKIVYSKMLRQLNKETRTYPDNQKIHFENAEELALELDFLTRNKVSHHSTFIINEGHVHNLFLSLKDVYDRYYMPSLRYANTDHKSS